jgi:hypothetical protein
LPDVHRVVRNAPILRRSAGMLNMLKPVQPIPAATVISETVVVSTTDTRSDILNSEPGPIVAAFADPEHDMDIVCVTATPAALEVTREGPNELWVKLTLTVCHEVRKALSMDCLIWISPLITPKGRVSVCAPITGLS